MSCEDITLIVICYNHARFVRSCIESVFHSSLSVNNLIVIDNNSSDNSREVIASLNTHFGFKSIFRTDSSLTRALNESLSHINTKYFSILAADDVMIRDRFRVQVEYFSKYPDASVIVGNVYQIGDDGQLLKPYMRDPVSEKVWCLEDFVLSRAKLYSPTALFKLKDVKDIGGWREDILLEDFYLFLKLLVKGYKVVSVEDFFVYYRLHSGNFHKKMRFMMSQKQAILDEYVDFSWYKDAVRFLYLEHFSAFCSYDKVYALRLLPKVVFSVQSKYLWIGIGRLLLDWRSYV